MLNICTAIINTLTADSTLTNIVSKNNISVGPVDIVQETQASLQMPQINVHPISESVRTVPLNAHDTRIQLDIWSRTSELEAQTILERVMSLLNYLSYDNKTTHVFWQRLGGTSSSYESSNRLWHYSQDFIFWSLEQ